MAKRTNDKSSRAAKPARGARAATAAKKSTRVAKKSAAKKTAAKKSPAKKAIGSNKGGPLKKVKPPHFSKHKTAGHVKRRGRGATTKKTTAPPGMVRIQKYLSQAGLASRRAVEEMIVEGRIVVNDQAVEALPCFVNPARDDIFVDGKRVRKHQSEQHVYLLANKPKGVLCTSSDPQGRKCLVEMLGDFPQRVYCVGRLDADSTGLILLSNDGELTQHLTHPSHEVPKTYRVTVEGRLDGESLEKLRCGVYLDGQRTRGVRETKILRRSPTSTALEMTLTEGRNREIRRLLRRMGHKVRRLCRIAIGPITDRGLKIGHVRQLTAKEVDWLKNTGQHS